FFYSCAFSFSQSFHLHSVLHSFPTRRSSDLGDPDFLSVGFPCEAVRPVLPAPRKNVRLARLRIEDYDVVCATVRFEKCDVCSVGDRKSTRLNSSHLGISYAVFCLKKKIITKD